MKFLALLRKELQEILPWALLAAIIFVTVGAALTYKEHLERKAAQENVWEGNMSGYDLKPLLNRIPENQRPELNEPYGYEVPANALVGKPPLYLFGPLLCLVSCSLCVLLAARQFLYPLYTKTLTFTMHRSLSRPNILLIKCTAAAIALFLACGLSWGLFLLYASRPGVYPLPPDRALIAESLVYLLIGPVLYIGAALSIVSTTRWYGTRLLGLVTAVVFAFVIPNMPTMRWCGVAFGLACLLLLPQLVHMFCSRDY